MILSRKCNQYMYTPRVRTRAHRATARHEQAAARSWRGRALAAARAPGLAATYGYALLYKSQDSSLYAI